MQLLAWSLALLPLFTIGDEVSQKFSTISRIVNLAGNAGAASETSGTLEERGNYHQPYPQYYQQQYHAEYGPSGGGYGASATPPPLPVHWPPEQHHPIADLEEYHPPAGWVKGGGSHGRGGGLLSSVVKSLLALLGAKLVLKVPLLLLKLLIAPVLLLAPLLSVLIPVYVTTTTTTTTTTTAATTTASSRRRKGKLDGDDEEGESVTEDQPDLQQEDELRRQQQQQWDCALSVACQLGAAWGHQGYLMLNNAGVPVSQLNEYGDAFMAGVSTGACDARVEQCRQQLQREGRLPPAPYQEQR